MKPHETGTDNPIDFPKQMNANELAGQLQIESSNMEYGYVVSDWELLSDAADLIVKQAYEIEELKTTVRSLFEDFIDIREESDSGRVFAPITISSCRCMMIEPLANVLAKMRTLSGAKKRSEG